MNKRRSQITKRAPKVIYLQVCDETDEMDWESEKDFEGTTWCKDAVFSDDVKYIRADLVITMKEKPEVNR